MTSERLLSKVAPVLERRLSHWGKARRLSARGGSVLFLCYNSALRNFLAKHHCVPNVHFHSFHSLASSVLRNSYESIEALEAAFMERLTDPSFVLPYDHVLIDEGQDFPDEWIDALEPAQGDYYVFFDRNQLVQRPRMPEWVDRSECRLTLTRNCRKYRPDSADFSACGYGSCHCRESDASGP